MPTTGSQTIGFIGTGVMGASMAGHLLAAGHRLRVHSRTRTKAEPLLAAGATWAGTPREAADGADVVVSIVGYPADVEQVHLGPHGTLSATRVPQLIIDMTTSRPSLAVHIAEQAAKRDSFALDAPVSGGDVGARNATLAIMVGGEQSAFVAAVPILGKLGSSIVRQGAAGAGQHCKVVNQILIAGIMMGIAEGLLYGTKAGLDLPTMLSAVGGGAAGSWALQNLVPRILKGDERPGFFIELFVKDLGIALDEAERMQLDLPAVALARKYYETAMKDGHGKLGTQALYRTIAEKQGVLAAKMA